jgi:hypothetical protein
MLTSPFAFGNRKETCKDESNTNEPTRTKKLFQLQPQHKQQQQQGDTGRRSWSMISPFSSSTKVPTRDSSSSLGSLNGSSMDRSISSSSSAGAGTAKLVEGKPPQGFTKMKPSPPSERAPFRLASPLFFAGGRRNPHASSGQSACSSRLSHEENSNIRDKMLRE